MGREDTKKKDLRELTPEQLNLVNGGLFGEYDKANLEDLLKEIQLGPCLQAKDKKGNMVGMAQSNEDPSDHEWQAKGEHSNWGQGL